MSLDDSILVGNTADRAKPSPSTAEDLRRETSTEHLIRMSSTLSRWLLGRALPLWGGRGHDPARGGFYDTLDFNSVSNAALHKRLRVLTRQIYVFAQGSRMGHLPGRRLVRSGVEFLLGRARNPDGGFCARFALDGEVIDASRDLYDLAFCLFALAHAWDVLRDDSLKEEAETLYRFLEDRLAHPSGGFVEGLPAEGPRRQNPHMHLLEALSAWDELVGGVWRERADRVVDLALSRFIDPESGALVEYFADDWSPLEGARGDIVEPGHLFEWIWLLARHEVRTGRRHDEIDRLYAFAWSHGVDHRTGRLHAEVRTDGSRVEAGPTRLWPHAEWLKAELAMWERHGATHYLGRAALAYDALGGFLEVSRPGLWYERASPEAGYIDEPSPASSLYHITLAIAELVRVAGRANEEFESGLAPRRSGILRP